MGRMPKQQANPHPRLCCPKCDYNLHGLTEPRCPECGTPFEWAEMLEARTRLHPYLFEHHPESEFRSFWRTAWGGLREPWRFWESLHPRMPSQPRRLVLYWVAAMVVSAISVVAEFVAGTVVLSHWSGPISRLPYAWTFRTWRGSDYIGA